MNNKSNLILIVIASLLLIYLLWSPSGTEPAADEPLSDSPTNDIQAVEPNDVSDVETADTPEVKEPEITSPLSKSEEAPINKKENKVPMSDEAKQIAREIGNRPKKIEHIVGLSPAVVDGETIGFNIEPGLNPALFRSIRFESGDVLTKLNKLDLTKEQALEQSAQEISSAQTLVFEVLRNGKPKKLYLDIPNEGLSISR